MGLQRVTGWLAVAVAVAAAAQDLDRTLQLPVSWILRDLVGLLPVLGLAVAGALLIRSARGARAAATYIVVTALLEVAFLPTHVHWAVDRLPALADTWPIVIAIVEGVLVLLALGLLRASPVASEDEEPPGPPARAAGAAGGLLVAAGGLLVWTTAAGMTGDSWALRLFNGPVAFDLTTLARVGVLFVATLLIAVTTTRTAHPWVGGTVALVLAQGPLWSSWLSFSAGDPGQALAAGFWVSVAGQLLLAIALGLHLARPGSRAPTAPTGTTRPGAPSS